MERACEAARLWLVIATAQHSTPSVGMYLTDEVFLYCVVSAFDEIVELEDCYWLDVVRVPANRLSERRLRVVSPALRPPRLSVALGATG
jgi:hypothetical protein